MLRLTAALVAVLLLPLPSGGAARVAANTSGQAGAQEQQDERTGTPSTQPPVSMDRIRQGLFAVPVLKLPSELPPVELDEAVQRPTFRIEVFGEPPSLQDLFKGVDLTGGPVPRGPATHSEFLAMVTPRELYSSAGINALELLTAGLSARAIEWLVARAMADARKRAEDEERERIQQRIDRELQEIEDNRRARPPNQPGP